MNKNSNKNAFSIAELLITMLIVCLVAAAIVPFIGPKKVKAPHLKVNNGLFQCYWEGNNLMQADKEYPQGRDVTSDGYCSFTFPDNGHAYTMTFIGAGGNGWGPGGTANENNIKDEEIPRYTTRKSALMTESHTVTDLLDNAYLANSVSQQFKNGLLNMQNADDDAANPFSIPVVLDTYVYPGEKGRAITVTAGQNQNGENVDNGKLLTYYGSDGGNGNMLSVLLWLSYNNGAMSPNIKLNEGNISIGDSSSATITKPENGKNAVHGGAGCDEKYLVCDKVNNDGTKSSVINLKYSYTLDENGDRVYNNSDTKLEKGKDSKITIKNLGTKTESLEQDKFDVNDNKVDNMFYSTDIISAIDNTGSGFSHQYRAFNNQDLIKASYQELLVDVNVGGAGKPGGVATHTFTNVSGKTLRVRPGNNNATNVNLRSPLLAIVDEGNNETDLLSAFNLENGNDGLLIRCNSNTEVPCGARLTQDFANNITDAFKQYTKNDESYENFIPENANVDSTVGRAGHGSFPLITNEPYNTVFRVSGFSNYTQRGDNIWVGTINSDNAHCFLENDLIHYKVKNYCKATKGQPGAVFIEW